MQKKKACKLIERPVQDKSHQKNSSVVHEQTSGFAGVDGGEAG